MNKNSGLRRALISFSWTWLAFMTFVTMISLFSIWSMNRAYERGYEEMQQIRQLQDHALNAQIDFKLQVQEWKNLLLRGNEPADRQRYLTAFEAQEQSVQIHLDRIAWNAAELDLQEYADKAVRIRAEHDGLGANYRNAIEAAGLLDWPEVRATDAKVRGMDRPIEAAINLLAADITGLTQERARLQLERLHDRYLTLRNFIVIVMIIVLLVTAVSLYGVLRATGPDA